MCKRAIGASSLTCDACSQGPEFAKPIKIGNDCWIVSLLAISNMHFCVALLV